MAKHSAALKRLLKGLDDPDSQDPAGFGREDVSRETSSGCRTVTRNYMRVEAPTYTALITAVRAC